MINQRDRIAADIARRRGAEHACALDFLVYGDDEAHGPHADRCICSSTCSREYDIRPYAEAEPVDVNLYTNTGIGALYGFPEGDYRQLWQLAGWNIVRRGSE